jgi:hypothetical protein
VRIDNEAHVQRKASRVAEEIEHRDASSSLGDQTPILALI